MMTRRSALVNRLFPLSPVWKPLVCALVILVVCGFVSVEPLCVKVTSGTQPAVVGAKPAVSRYVQTYSPRMPGWFNLFEVEVLPVVG